MRPFTIILALPFLLAFNDLKAQSLKRDLISISIIPKYNFNKANIVNDNFTASYLTAQNNVSTSFGISYRHITKRGLIIGYGVDIGKETHNISTIYDLDDHDPRATRYVSNPPFSKDYEFVSIHITQKLIIGYTMPLPLKKAKGWYAEARVGIALKALPRSNDSVDRYRRIYATDSGRSIDAPITNSLIKLSYSNKPSFSSSNNSFVQLWEAYIGVRKDIDIGIAQTMNIGIEFAHNLAPKRDIDNKIDHRSFSYTPDNNYSSMRTHLDNYFNRSISLGLRISIGLWP